MVRIIHAIWNCNSYKWLTIAESFGNFCPTKGTTRLLLSLVDSSRLTIRRWGGRYQFAKVIFAGENNGNSPMVTMDEKEIQGSPLDARWTTPFSECALCQGYIICMTDMISRVQTAELSQLHGLHKLQLQQGPEAHLEFHTDLMFIRRPLQMRIVLMFHQSRPCGWSIEASAGLASADVMHLDRAIWLPLIPIWVRAATVNAQHHFWFRRGVAFAADHFGHVTTTPTTRLRPGCPGPPFWASGEPLDFALRRAT